MLDQMLDHLGSLPETGLSTVLIVLLLSSFLLFHLIPKSSTPFVNKRKPFELGYAHAKNRFLVDAKNLIDTGLKQVSCIPSQGQLGSLLSIRPVSFGFSQTAG